MSEQVFKIEKSTLYIVATPIGNMDDMTLRAIETLNQVDLVLCEDTRETGGLLSRLKIDKPMQALHQHSDEEQFTNVAEEIRQGKSFAYVTDSGTPSISDPGIRLVQAARKVGVKVLPIPGPSAVTSAVSVSGMVKKEFYFAGFLPKKKGRKTELEKLSNLDVPVVLYESTYRIEKTLKDLKEHFGGDAEVFVAREMTKKFEEYWGGNIMEVVEYLDSHVLRGEFVVVVKN